MPNQGCLHPAHFRSAVKLANSKLDECRRRVQNETLGHRGHKHDPLYRCRRLLTKAHELDWQAELVLNRHYHPAFALS